MRSMRSRRPVRRASIAHRERVRRRVRRGAVLVLAVAVVVVTLVLTAFGTGPRRTAAIVPAAPPPVVVANGPPKAQVVALAGSLQLELPVAQAHLTAIGYHAAGAADLALHPVGRRGNNGFLRRLLDRIAGSGHSHPTWYQLAGGDGRPTSGLDVGAPAGTDVYAPVDGTVVAIEPYVLDGKRHAARVDIQPGGAPSLVVSVSRIHPARRLAVGDVVTAARTRLGRVVDLSAVERQALARYTHDAGNHVTLEVRPAASPALG